MKTITKSISIAAPVEKVWKTLLDDAYTKQWYSVFSPGSHAVTDWKEGSKAIFQDEKCDGMIAKVITNKKFEELTLEYEGEMIKGKEDFESDAAKSVKGGRESYKLKSNGGSTDLSISSDMSEEYADHMSAAWDKALAMVKEITESES